MIAWSDVAAWVAQVPPGVWVAAMVANMVLTALTWSTARSRVRRAGQRVADPELVSGDRRAKDTVLTVASLVPAALFWVMVLAGSFHGLVAFGRSTLGWRDGWEYLVPGTLDGGFRHVCDAGVPGGQEGQYPRPLLPGRVGCGLGVRDDQLFL